MSRRAACFAALIVAAIVATPAVASGSTSASNASRPQHPRLLRYVGPRVITFYYGHAKSVSLAGDFVVGPGHRSTGHKFSGPRICAGALPASAGFFHWKQPHVGHAGGLVRCTIVYTGKIYPVPYAGQPAPRVWKSNPRVLFLYSSIKGGTPLAGPFIIRFVLRKQPSQKASLQLSGTLKEGNELTTQVTGTSSPVFTVDGAGHLKGSATMQEHLTVQGGTEGCTISGGVSSTVIYSWSGDVIDPRTEKVRLDFATKGTATGSVSISCNIAGAPPFSETIPSSAVLPTWSTTQPVVFSLDDHSPQVILRDQTPLGPITLTLTIPR